VGRPLLLAAIAALSVTFGLALFARAGAAGDATRFRTPDAGAACRLERTALVCSSLGSAASVALRSRGAPDVVRELPWWDASTPVLHRWHHHSVACTLSGAAILCRNHRSAIRVDRAGFAVAL
jgi:hypothetical protein